jgi:pimeloyl-ACP methyl ester carboxylesterase
MLRLSAQAQRVTDNGHEMNQTPSIAARDRIGRQSQCRNGRFGEKWPALTPNHTLLRARLLPQGLRMHPRSTLSTLGLTIMLLLASLPAWAAEEPAYGPQLEGFDYPWPVAHFRFASQNEALDMAYMDVSSDHPNGQTIALLHGKNFCAATWQATITALAAEGYRVIAPDQIGFCKSTKPAHYQYSFQQLANNTHALLASLGIAKAGIMGHSTGGMLAIRYGLMYPTQVSQLILVNPIGLEDWKAKGVPWQSADAWYQQERLTTADRIREYERATYYAGEWQPDYEKWAQMLAGLYRGPGRDLVAWNAALLSDMIYTQPVIYEIGHLGMPVLLMIGDRDTTAIGKNLAPPAIRPTLGNYEVLGREAVAQMPNARLIEFAHLGHAPQIQDPDTFHKALLEAMRQPEASIPTADPSPGERTSNRD